MPKKPEDSDKSTALRERAEARLRRQRSKQQPTENPERLLHELQVHQIELEMQNAELLHATSELERARARYSELYDFAPMGYLTVDEASEILEANLTASTLLGVERSRLIGGRLSLLVDPQSRADLLAALQRAFQGSELQSCQALFNREGGDPFWAELRANSEAGSEEGAQRCRVVFTDMASRAEVEEAERRMESAIALTDELRKENSRRRKVEKDLTASERKLKKLLVRAAQLRLQARRLSHRVLQAQEEERKRVSRELHDEIAQTLVGVTLRLASLTHGPGEIPKPLRRKIMDTRRLVQKSVEIVHRFARELRPTVLDDLGLIPALRSIMGDIARREGLLANLTASKSIDKLDITERTVLYRVAQEALVNIARHAEASRVDVTIREKDGRVTLTVSDDGKSFPVKRLMRASTGEHLGLLGMQERLEMVGGSLRITSSRGKGTTVYAEIPLDAAGSGGGGMTKPVDVSSP